MLKEKLQELLTMLSDREVVRIKHNLFFYRETDQPEAISNASARVIDGDNSRTSSAAIIAGLLSLPEAEIAKSEDIGILISSLENYPNRLRKPLGDWEDIMQGFSGKELEDNVYAVATLREFSERVRTAARELQGVLPNLPTR